MAKSPNSGSPESCKRLRRDSTWSEEYDCLPLKQRKKLLLAQKGLSEMLLAVKFEVAENSNSSQVKNHVVVKEEADDSESLSPTSFIEEKKLSNLSSYQSHTGELEKQVTEANHVMNATVIEEKVNIMGTGSIRQSLLSENAVPLTVKCSDRSQSGFLRNCRNSLSGVDLAAVKVKTESFEDIFDDLDLVPLRERQRSLLSRQKKGLIDSSAEGNPMRLSSFLRKQFSGSEAKIEKCLLSSNTNMLDPAVKIEPQDGTQTMRDKTVATSLPSYDVIPVKYEHDMADNSDTDELDHMLLSERMKLFSKNAKVPSLETKGIESSSKVAPSCLDSEPIAPEAVKRPRGDHPWKRKKTATDSVETALEEDVPGLLQVLVEQGVSVDEIKLYGEPEIDEVLEESNDDNFAGLESVMAKVFSQRTSLLKLAPLRSTRGEKASYCLACLFSLVEQARYLQFRKWPVEWGWSRDLQSFIFVFQRHNRIVLERPEYGYATYFFELVNSLPIDWQIKRLVIAMKLTSCGRITLIENKALEVGQDITEGEAKVLMEYGWIPNTGLGTMLNYRERVVHDRKNERDTSEWRTKIGKLLVDGYNGGTLVSTDLPRKALEHNFAECPEIKLELE